MQINGLNPQPGTVTHALMNQASQNLPTPPVVEEDEDDDDPYAPQDVYEPSTPNTPSNTNNAGRDHIRSGGRQFGNGGIDASALRDIMAEGRNATNSFRSLVEGLFNRQAETSNEAFGGFANAGLLEGFLLGGGTVPVDSETQTQAQALLDTVFSVEATAGRIMGFAVAISGGDLENNPWVEQAVNMGFGQATNSWGSNLPDISQRTLEAVQNAFEEWRTYGAEGINLLNS